MTENPPESGTSDGEQKRPDAPRRVFACCQYPRLAIRSMVKFENGFFSSSDPELHALIERNQAFGVQIVEITDAVNLKRSQPSQSVYVSLGNPALTIGHVVFRDRLLVTNDFNVQRIVKLAREFGTEIRDLNDVLKLEAAPTPPRFAHSKKGGLV